MEGEPFDEERGEIVEGQFFGVEVDDFAEFGEFAGEPFEAARYFLCARSYDIGFGERIVEPVANRLYGGFRCSVVGFMSCPAMSEMYF